MSYRSKASTAGLPPALEQITLLWVKQQMRLLAGFAGPHYMKDACL